MRTLPNAPTLLAVFAIVMASACSPSAAQLAIESVAQARNDAHQQPGPRQAVSYAEAVHQAREAGSYSEDTRRLEGDGRDAISRIEAVLPSAGADGPLLVAWEGVLYADMGLDADSRRAFERSMELGPNLIAADHLLPIYGRANPPAGVGRVCSSTVPVIPDADDRFSLIEKCRKATNAVTEEAMMSWANPPIIAWYQEEKQRRAALAEAELQKMAERQAYERQILRQAEICFAHCKQKGLLCQNRCEQDEVCAQRCVEVSRACLDQCESAAHLELGQ